MSLPVRRVVKSPPEFLDKFDFYLGGGSEDRPSTHEFLESEYAPHVLSAFRERWDELPWFYLNDPRVRFYEFRGDLIPSVLFVGRLDGVSITDEFIEEEITLTHLQVDFGEQPLEDPDDPTPDR